MKTLMLTDKMELGGAETHIFTLTESLLRSGIEVTLVSAGGIYADKLEKLGARCVNAPLDRRDAKSFLRAKAMVSDEMMRADIIHAHTRFTSFLAHYIRGERKSPPIIVTAHLNFPLFPFGPFAFYGDRTLAVSSDIKDYLMKYYKIPEERITVTKNCVDAKLFGGERREKKLIVHTSRIDTGRSKCAFMLLDIAKDLLEKHPDYRILILGDGNMYKKLCAAVERVNSFLGFKGIILGGARDDVPELLRYASVFVGVSRAAIEAMAFGISTVIAGDEGYGGIISSENFRALEESNFCARNMPRLTRDKLLRDIEYLIENPQQKRITGEFCKATVTREYTPMHMAEDAIRAYKKAMRPPSVCLMGFFGYSNLGDEETLKSAVSALQKLGINDISVLLREKKQCTILPKNVKLYDRMNPYEIASAINGCDIFVLCGGNLLQNETSLRSLLYYEEAIRYAKRAGRAVYMLSSGIGDIRGPLAKILLKRSLYACDYMGMRTAEDLRHARLNSKGTNIRLMPDLCFLLPEVTSELPRLSFALILSKNTKISPAEIIRISGARGLIPYVIMLYPPEDFAVAERFRRANIKCYTPTSATAITKILSGCAFSLSDRLHGAIFSIISHTPTYITEDSCKNRALLGEISKRQKALGASTIIHPYSMRDVLQKKEVGAHDSDFRIIINDIKEDIKLSLNEIF